MKSLSKVLRWNAVFSSVCGIVFAAFPVCIATLTGAPAYVLLPLGIGLMGFAMLVYRSFRNPVRSHVRTIAIMDLGWVAGSFAVLLLPVNGLSFAGILIIAVIACIVAMFGTMQLYFTSKLKGR